MTFLLYIYSTFLSIAVAIISLVAPFKEKFKKAFDKRRTWLSEWNLVKDKMNQKRVLIHCASHGEFEQAKPLIAYFKAHTDYSIIVSFFSPSGYDQAINYSNVDHILYLPFDTAKKSRAFLDEIKPTIVLWMRYELWPVMLNEIFDRKIPCYLISASFNNNMFYFKWYGKHFKTLLGRFDQIYLQNKPSFDILKAHNFSNISLSGDTRIDRIMDTVQTEDLKNSWIPLQLSQKPILILGSIWPEDWALFKDSLEFICGQFHLIIAPHEISKDFLQKIKKDMQVFGIASYTEIDIDQLDKTTLQNILLDTVGELSKIYRFGQVSYIGGAFKQGLHNVLEPAAYGLPIIFGPQIEKFPEAIDLIRLKCAHSVKTSIELQTTLSKLIEKADFEQIKINNKNYTKQGKGASMRICSDIKKRLTVKIRPN